MRKLLLVAASALSINSALAQSSPGLVAGQVPTPAQWNSYFTAKQDFPLALPACGALQWTGAAITCNTGLASGAASQATSADDLSTNTTYYPLLSSGFAGTFPLFTSSNNFSINPSTGIALNNQGVIYSAQLCSGSADANLSNGTAVQAAITCTASGQVTLHAATAYQFECQYLITSSGTASHTWSTAFGGGASFTSLAYSAMAVAANGTGPTAALINFNTTAAASVVTAASTSATENTTIKLRGVMRINSGGTVIPQVKLSAAPGAAPVMKANSFCAFNAVGNNTFVSVGNWN